MGLFSHKRIHESGIRHSVDALCPSCTLTMSSSTQTPPSNAATVSSFTTATISETGTSDLSCQYYPLSFISRIGLAGHLRIHRTATAESQTGAPTPTCHIRNNCPHCTRTPTTEWAYQATCAFTKTCGRQPPAKSHHRIFPHQCLHRPVSSSVTSIHLSPPTQVEVFVSTQSPCGSYSMYDSGLRLSPHIKCWGLEGCQLTE
ncbi:hypothetical protein SprV_0100217800 [Sparganum proliferum]